MNCSNDILIKKFVKDRNFLITSNGTIFKIKNKKLFKCPLHMINGYKIIKYKNKNLRVHRIIYLKFIGFLNNSLVINHKDGNRANNSVNNLELVTISENNFHSYRVLRNPAIAGNRKICFQTAEKIRSEYKHGSTYKILCEKYELSKSTISYIINNKIWVNK